MENVEKNRFFKIAKERASGVLENNARLRNLVQNAGNKISEIDMKNIKNGKFLERVRVMMRMLRAYRKGEYRGIPWQTLVLMVAALIYFVTPIDLVPDFIPITGLIDDFTVMLWVYNKVQNEIDNFLTWEKQAINA